MADISILKDKAGNEVGLIGRDFCPSWQGYSRYTWDWDICGGSDWIQYDTSQDASYFGVWVNPTKRMTITYAEGDVTACMYKDDAAFRQEIQEMNEFYGAPPPAFIGIGEDGVTNYYDESAAHGREIPGV